MHDVVVVGGGVAGSATAIQLAEAGLRVLLLDRAQFPRPKVCGEGIFPPGVEELRRLGVLDDVGAHGARIDRLRFEMAGPAAETWLSPARSSGLGVERALLDNALLRRAEAAGVEVRQGVAVQGLVDEGASSYRAIRTDGGDIEGRCIVAADGLRSVLRTQAGLEVATRKRRYGANAHFVLAGSAGSRIDVYFRDGHEVYVTPVGERTVNVALLCDAATAKSLSGDLSGAFLGRVKPVMPRESLELLDEVRATGPFPAASRMAWRKNLLLVGDAAGFFDGISGEGISLALQSARLAAGAVTAYLETGSEDAFRHYNRAVRALRRPSTLFARLILALAERPALARRALNNLSRRPDTFARLAAVNSGELRLQDLRPRDLLGLTLGL